MMDETETQVSKLAKEIAQKMKWENYLIIAVYPKDDKEKMGINLEGRGISKEMMEFTAERFNSTWASMKDEKLGSLGFRGMMVER